MRAALAVSYVTDDRAANLADMERLVRGAAAGASLATISPSPRELSRGLVVMLFLPDCGLSGCLPSLPPR